MTRGHNRRRPRQIVKPGWFDAIRNGAVFVGLWWLYSLVRSATAHSEERALSNAEHVRRIEQLLGLDVEIGLQQLANHPAVFTAANVYYLAHFPLTVLVLSVAYWRDRRGVFVRLRNGLIAASGAALLVHVVAPLAPPRMLVGVIDSGRVYGPDAYAIPGSSGANQFAAMPSMHVAWAILAAIAVRGLVRSSSVRFFASVHPIATILVVVVTGHHFVADVVAGSLIAAAGAVAVSRLRSDRETAISPHLCNGGGAASATRSGIPHDDAILGVEPGRRGLRSTGSASPPTNPCRRDKRYVDVSV